MFRLCSTLLERHARMKKIQNPSMKDVRHALFGCNPSAWLELWADASRSWTWRWHSDCHSISQRQSLRWCRTSSHSFHSFFGQSFAVCQWTFVSPIFMHSACGAIALTHQCDKQLPGGEQVVKEDAMIWWYVDRLQHLLHHSTSQRSVMFGLCVLATVQFVLAAEAIGITEGSQLTAKPDWFPLSLWWIVLASCS